MMALTEVYCLVNRARGMEVIHALTIAHVGTASKLSLNPVLSTEVPPSLHSAQLLSPEDLVNACKMFESLKLPLR